jgi:rhomboid protease GluP
MSNDDEFQRTLRRLQDEEQRQQPPQPQGEVLPGAPPGGIRLRLPLGAQTPWVARVLLGLNIAIFVIPWLLSNVLGAPIDQLVLVLGAKDNAAIYQGGEYYRFLTAMFLHGGLTHIAFNAFALYSLGFETERIYGHWRFLAVYLLAGLGGGVASYALNPSPSVGASGAIFGLIGALAVFYYEARAVLGGVARQQLGSLIFTLLINLGLGFSVALIDNNAHLGGLAVGAIAGWLLAPRYVVEAHLYPPRVERRGLAWGWPGAAVLLVALIAAAMLIVPPIR